MLLKPFAKRQQFFEHEIGTLDRIMVGDVIS
jgi:hypothetical protein